MRTLSFEQMEVVNGGESCAGLGTVAFLGAVGMFAAAPFTFGLSAKIGWGLTAYAYGQYFACQVNKLN